MIRRNILTSTFFSFICFAILVPLLFNFLVSCSKKPGVKLVTKYNPPGALQWGMRLPEVERILGSKGIKMEGRYYSKFRDRDYYGFVGPVRLSLSDLPLLVCQVTIGNNNEGLLYVCLSFTCDTSSQVPVSVKLIETISTKYGPPGLQNDSMYMWYDEDNSVMGIDLSSRGIIDVKYMSPFMPSIEFFKERKSTPAPNDF